MKKRSYKILSLIFLLLGLYLIEPKITGAVIGITSTTSLIGIILVLIAGVLFAAGTKPVKSGFEKKLEDALENPPETTAELEKICREADPKLERKRKRGGYKVLGKTPKGYRTVTTIPPESRHIGPETSKRIIRAVRRYVA